jgi:hypothetical protein
MLLRSSGNVAQERDQEQDDKQEKQNFGDTGGGHGNTREAENRGNQSHYKENQSPAKHHVPPS